MKRLPTFLIALTLAGCATIPAQPRNDGLARLGEPTYVENLIVTPEQVVEDSRCPMNARCVWAGRVVLRTQVEGAGTSDSVDLILGEPYRIAGGNLALTSVMPEHVAGEETKPGDYIFGFEFTR